MYLTLREFLPIAQTMERGHIEIHESARGWTCHLMGPGAGETPVPLFSVCKHRGGLREWSSLETLTNMLREERVTQAITLRLAGAQKALRF